MPNENCIFCKIVAGEIPSYKIYEDSEVLAFLDISQTTPGHTLVIPKKHVQDIYHLTAEEAGNIFARVPMIARAIKASNPEIKGMNIVNNNGEIAYQSVLHAHFHLIPRYSENDDFSIHFGNHESDYDKSKYTALQEAIKEQIK